MPGERCARCGTVRTPGGCACAPAPYDHPDVVETAVLPHIEGPPLVRPYVPAAAEYEEPHPDAFPTALLPPVPPQDPYATAVLPPVPPQPYRSVPAQPQPAELGIFAFQQADRRGGQYAGPLAGGGPGGRAERRAQEHESPVRRKAAMAAAGVAIVVIGAGIAYSLMPSSDSGKGNEAVPLPVVSLQPPATSEPPSAAPTTSAPASPSPSPTKASPRPSRTASRAPAAAVTSAKPSPSAAPTTAAPSPTQSGPPTLRRGMSGPDVRTMQQMLRACGDPYVRVNGKYDGQTEQAVSSYQQYAGVQGDPDGVYGPNTRTALESGDGC
ncbi:peptidoglycan-binding protein [Kitasatospora sp. GP82]|uniref:peptidoglycan-binding protein n=1 Tax=Kitasatospora sp. GP82 TaxID=3035089 RepID=UPI0024771A36|nr:peptidoglycan-binding protein [Kitasatospora sp. GP82]MDH6126802.1 hypothetical protein [Kitasatospora sp. GP82]